MGIIELVKDEEMRTLFGKRELEIIRKQLLGEDLTDSERVRLSRDIRPKFKIIRKLSNFAHEFELKKAQEVKRLSKEVVEEILNSHWKERVEKIFLFGSSVKGQRRRKSDIDIGVVFDEITKKESTKFRIEISGKIRNEIDLQVVNVLPKKIQDSIYNEGEIIYKK